VRFIERTAKPLHARRDGIFYLVGLEAAFRIFSRITSNISRDKPTRPQRGLSASQLINQTLDLTTDAMVASSTAAISVAAVPDPADMFLSAAGLAASLRRSGKSARCRRR
jgi:hypothetical protein